MSETPDRFSEAGPTPRGVASIPLQPRRVMLEAFEISPRAYGELESSGVIQAARRGRGGHGSLFDMVPTTRAYVGHLRNARPAGSDRMARARRDETQAVLNELRIAAQRGELLPRGEIARAWGQIVGAIRSRILGMPSSLATRLVGITDPALVERVLHDECYSCLRELSNWEPPSAMKDELSGDADTRANGHHLRTKKTQRKETRP